MVTCWSKYLPECVYIHEVQQAEAELEHVTEVLCVHRWGFLEI